MSTDPVEPDFDVERVDMDGGAVRIAPRGELDLNTGFRLERAIKAVEEESPEIIVVDLRAVAAHRRGAAGGWRVSVVRGTSIVDTVLRTTRLDAYLDVVDDPAEALVAPGERVVSD
jgi:hypothetical protein